MEISKKKLPVGIEDFEELRLENFYYVDKTGLDNLKVRSITDVRFDEYFGFTDAEVKELLEYYGYPDSYHAAREWYDGCHFGNVDVRKLHFCSAI